MGRQGMSLRVWFESAASVVAILLALVTIADPEWIETIFHVEPDEGGGWLELLITLGAAFVALVSAAVAIRDYRRPYVNRVASRED